MAGSMSKSAVRQQVDVRDLHHGTHNHLLTEESLTDAGAASLDAIIVPTAWPADALRHVMRVGRKVGCPVIALCSKSATAEQAVKLADHLNAAVLAVDVDSAVASGLPAFSTDRLLRDEGFGSQSDLSLKRNVGLALARASGWKRVLFLDDDIVVDDPQQLALAAGLLDRYRAVGLANTGYEDNSVVCHAFRAIGGDQQTFIGGGAMMVDTASTSSFFPNIYNEDWFFLLGDGLPFRVARAGVMRQRPYDPFANPARAAEEELGDTLAEGLFWILDFGQRPASAGDGFWGDALYRRRQFIDFILTRSGAAQTPDRIRRSLEAARGRSAEISHRLCRDFVREWETDLARWGDFLSRLPADASPGVFLRDIGIAQQVRQSDAYASGSAVRSR